jgi:hypothetical protein
VKDVGVFNYSATIKNENESAEKFLKLFVYQYPGLNLEAPTEAYVGLKYIYNIQAFDMFGEYVDKNGGEIRLQSETIPDIQFDSETHTIQWSPTEDNLGEHEFTVEVVDQFGLTTAVTHYVSVFMSPCELCKSAKRDRKAVKQVLTPVFKKDTPSNVEGNTTSLQTAGIDSTQVAPMDSLVIPPDSLSFPLDNLNVELDSTITPPVSEKVDSLMIPTLPDSSIIDTTIE